MLGLVLTIPEAVVAATLIALGSFAVRRIGKVHSDIAYLVEQWKPDGGGSLYDRFVMVEEGVREVGEKLMVEQSSRYFLWNHRPEALWECDADGRCIWGNKAMAEMFGLETADLRAFGWLQAIRHDHRENALRHWLESIEKNIPYADVYAVVNQRTGEEFNVRSTAESIDVGGSPRLFFGSCERLVEKVRS